jgi:alkylated DNA repair dioxygenase AlkB
MPVSTSSDLVVHRDWCDGTDLLAAVRQVFTYGPRDDRATGYLFGDGQPWPGPLAVLGPALLDDLDALLGIRFTVVAFQAYMDGSGCDWHSDDAFDAQAVLSLGVTRTFGVRRKDGSDLSLLPVDHGDLVFMPPGFQATWQHCVPIEQVAGERCSLVLRTVERIRL